MVSTRILSVAALLLLTTSCQDLEQARELPNLDFESYRCEVEPVLIERCSFVICHGNAERPFRLLAPARYRPGFEGEDEQVRLDDDESRANFDAARAMAQSEGLDGSLLLLKPLDVNAGGFFHEGKLPGGSDAFTAQDEPSYRVIEAWLANGSACQGGSGP